MVFRVDIRRSYIHRVSVHKVVGHVIFTNYLLSSEQEGLIVFFFLFFLNKPDFDGKVWAVLRYQSEPKAL